MARDVQEVVAQDLWLLIAIVTFVLISLAGMAGLGAVSGTLAIIGWFLLTPIFLFWGEEIAAWFFETDESVPTRDTEDGALEELKRRYAEGEIDTDEFEHRLERLVEVEDFPDGGFTARSVDDDATALDRNGARDASRPETDSHRATGDVRERERE